MSFFDYSLYKCNIFPQKGVSVNCLVTAGGVKFLIHFVQVRLQMLQVIGKNGCLYILWLDI